MSRKGSFSFQKVPEELSIWNLSTPYGSSSNISARRSAPKNTVNSPKITRPKPKSESRFSNWERRRLSGVLKKDLDKISMFQLFKAAPLRTTKSTARSILTSGKTPLSKAKANIRKSDKIMFQK